ncbi:hypothetical protein PF005_g12052 [Phytophthora fragariae]|nr:hypothetical protein PR002_g20070 [Phytophthora rubi]KAE9208837.1 hypothetical protein PF005_g12052 [Phytophthora fragariae]KAE9228416.1 hypothetical protein PF002_g13544 [Phytophthora fragariae]KAE9340927.1 hypothetical protein PF008_g10886 [Phytophthora fragariae]
MHKGPEIERFNPDRDQVNVDHDMELHEKQSYIQSSTPLDGRQVSAASMIEKSEGRMSHLRVALEFGEEITEEELHAPYKSNTLRYIALRIAIIAILVVIAVLARKRFLDLQDFTGATAHTTSCLLMPLIIYMRVSWRTMSVYDKGASMIVIVACAFAGFYVMIHAGKHLFAPTDDDTLFPYCEEAFMDAPYYVRNNSTN